MDGEARHEEKTLLIKGDFRPARTFRVLRRLLVVCSLVLATGFVSALVLYGLVVHYSTQINTLSRDTRLIHEENKALQVRLNRLQSYQNVESAVARVPNLSKAEDVIEIEVPRTDRRFEYEPPRRHPDLPEVYGF